MSNTGPKTHKVIKNCPACGQKLLLPAGKVGRLTCPRCNNLVELSTKLTVGEPLTVAGILFLLWTIAVLTAKGTHFSLYVVFASSLIAYLTLYWYHKFCFNRPVDTKITTDARSYFAIMTATCTLFIACQISINALTHKVVSTLPVSTLLFAQSWLERLSINDLMSIAGKSASICLALLGILVWFKNTLLFNRIIKLRERINKLVKVASIVLICLASFSITTWSSGEHLLQLTGSKLAAERERIIESIDKMYGSLIIVFGENIISQLSQEIPDIKPSPPIETANATCINDHDLNVDRAFNCALFYEGLILQTPSDQSTIKKSLPLPLHETIKKIKEARSSVTITKSLYNIDTILNKNQNTKVREIHEKSEEICKRSDCDKITESDKSFARLTRIIAELAISGADWILPSTFLPEELQPLGSFWRKLFEEITTSQLKRKMQEKLSDLLQNIATITNSPAIHVDLAMSYDTFISIDKVAAGLHDYTKKINHKDTTHVSEPTNEIVTSKTSNAPTANDIDILVGELRECLCPKSRPLLLKNSCDGCRITRKCMCVIQASDPEPQNCNDKRCNLLQ